MRYVLLFLIALVLVDCYPYRQNTFTKEQRLKRKKKFKKEMVECLLEENISGKLKSKVEEYKEDDSKKVFFLLSSDISESDKLAVRKCRRQTMISVRKTFGGRFHRTFNRSNPHYREHLKHDDDEEKHGKNMTLLHHHKKELDPEHSNDEHGHFKKHHLKDFNATHSHPSGSSAHPHPSGSSAHSHPSGSSAHSHPSGSSAHPHPSGSSAHPHPSGSAAHPHPSNSTKQ